MAPAEAEAAIRKLESELEEEKGERITNELMALSFLLLYCFQ